MEGAPGGKLSCPDGLRLLSLSRTSPVVCRRDRGHRTGPKADKTISGDRDYDNEVFYHNSQVPNVNTVAPVAPETNFRGPISLWLDVVAVRGPVTTHGKPKVSDYRSTQFFGRQSPVIAR